MTAPSCPSPAVPPPALGPARRLVPDAWARAAWAIRRQARAVGRLAQHCPRAWAEAVHLVAGCRGQVVVTGLGKSGHVGAKISATLASLGLPSSFVHAAELGHGDLGRIRQGDVVLAVSHGGRLPGLGPLMAVLDAQRVPLVALTGHPGTPLGCRAAVVLSTRVAREACPWQLAPTASSTCALVLGDALATCAAEARGFAAADFARLHPAGALGRRAVRVGGVMRVGAAHVVVPADLGVELALIRLLAAPRRPAAASVVGPEGQWLGTFAPGELGPRLAAALGRGELVGQHLLSPPLALAPTLPLAVARRRLRRLGRRVASVVAADGGGRPLGLLDLGPGRPAGPCPPP